MMRGRTLMLARLSCGLTQEQLADAMGTSQAHLSRLEREICSPRSTTLIRWLDALGFCIVVKAKIHR